MKWGVRDVLAVLWSAPWRRAPWLLWRRPGMLVTVGGACVVLAAALAAVPLFLSSAGSEAVAVQAGERCPRDTGATYGIVAAARDIESPAHDPIAPLADKLGPTSQWVGLGADLAGPNGDTPVGVLARDDALDHVDVMEGLPGPGLWITDRAARITGLGAGDEAAVGSARVPVAGVYRDLAASRLDAFWCSNKEYLFWGGPGSQMPPPVLLADRRTFAELASALDAGSASVAGGVWVAPLQGDLTVAGADDLVHELACGAEKSPALVWCTDVENRGGRITQRVETVVFPHEFCGRSEHPADRGGAAHL